MSEFGELSQDEIRTLRQHRAMKSMQEKPLDKGAIRIHLIVAMRHLASIGFQVDPHDGMWQKLLEVLPGSKS